MRAEIRELLTIRCALSSPGVLGSRGDDRAEEKGRERERMEMEKEQRLERSAELKETRGKIRRDNMDH